MDSHINSLCPFSNTHYSMTKHTQKLSRSSWIFMDFHQEQLEKSCRVCGRRLKNARGKGRAFACTTHHTQLLDTFSVDISSDASDIHPPQFCFSCYGVIRRRTAAAKKGLPYSSSALQATFQWSMHTEDSCNVRTQF